MLTMEETFVVTGIAILVIGTALAFIGEHIFRKDNERDEEQ